MSAYNLERSFAQLAHDIESCKSNLLGLIGRKQMKSVQQNRINRGDSADINGRLQQTPIAIIGMASVFPNAKNAHEYWENILRQVDCITDVPASRWNIEDYYDPDPFAPDKTYCKRGGFIPDVEFDPLEFGLPPKLLEATENLLR